MFNSILVAVDPSEAAQEALDLACRLAQEDHAKVVLVNVVDVSKLVVAAGYEAPYPVDAIEMMRDEGRQLLDEAKQRCQKQGLDVTLLSAEGEASERILQVADEQHAGLICMGTHGRKGFSHLFVGSVAESVLRGAKVPVLVIRPTKHA